jgi:hypothetical protein
MSEERTINADDLTKTRKPGDIQLTEEELSKASGGLGDIKGESSDEKHKSE